MLAFFSNNRGSNVNSTFWVLLLVFMGCVLSSCSNHSPVRELALTANVKILEFGNGQIEDNTLGSTVLLEIDGCASGYSKIMPSTQQEIQLYINDLGCRAKIKSVTTSSGEVFIIKAGEAFGYLPGQLTPFVSNIGNELQVLTVSNLSSPVLPSDEIAFSFLSAQGGEVLDINSNRSIVRVSSSTAEVVEGDNVRVEFEISKVLEANAETLEVFYQLSGSASAGTDYVLPSGVLAIPAGQKTATVSIDLINDRFAESLEVIVLELKDSQDYLHYAKGQVIILDDDVGVPSQGLVMHLKPEDFESSGGNISSWTDSSLYNQDVSQSRSRMQPLLNPSGIGGYNSALFDGVNDVLDISSSPEINSAGPYNQKAIFIVFETGEDVQRRQIIYEQGEDQNGLILFIDNGQLHVSVYSQNMPWPKYFSTPIQAGAAYYTSMVLSSGRLTGYLFDREIGSSSVPSDLARHGAAGIGGSNGSRVLFPDGSNSSQDCNFQGNIGEVIYYNGPMQSDTVFSVQNYLEEKFSLNQPILTVLSSKGSISESGGDSANFIFTKSIPQSHEVRAEIVISGGAMPGEDYEAITSTVVFRPYETEVSIGVIAIDDQISEIDIEDIVVTIMPSESYIIGSGSASILITDDESVGPKGDYHLWLTAQVGLQLNGELVTGWIDQSNYAQIVNQSTLLKQPRFDPGGVVGKESVRFDGVDDSLWIENSYELNQQTFYAKSLGMVFKSSDDIVSRQVLYEQGRARKGLSLYIDRGQLYFHVWGTSNGSFYTSMVIEPNVVYRVLGSFNSDTSELNLTVNQHILPSVLGVGTLRKGVGAIGVGAVNVSTNFHDGSSSADHSFNGHISELIIFNHELSAFERESLIFYFDSTYPTP